MSCANNNNKKDRHSTVTEVTPTRRVTTGGKNTPVKKKKKKKCGCLIALIVFVVVIGVILTSGYFVGDHFAKKYLDCSASDILTTLNGVSSVPEKRIVKKGDRYKEADLAALENILKDRLLLSDDYKIPYDKIQDITDKSVLASMISEEDIDASKLSEFVYDGPNAQDVTISLTPKGFAGLLDNIAMNLDLTKIAALQNAGLPMPIEAIELNFPQMFFLKESNPSFSHESQTDIDNEGDPKYIYSIKFTVQIKLNKLVKGILDTNAPSVSPWVSWLIPKNLFVTMEIPVNVGYETKSPSVYINNMSDKRMEAAFRVIDGVMSGQEENFSENMLRKFSEALQPMLNTLNSVNMFNFKEDASGNLYLKLDIIKTILEFGKIEGIETRDIYLVLKTILIDAGIDFDAVEEIIKQGSAALNGEFKEKYLLKEETSVSDLVNDLMGNSGGESGGTVTLSTSEGTQTETDKLLGHVDTARLSSLYKVAHAADLDLKLTENMLASLLRDVIKAGAFDVGGMEFDVVKVSLSKNEAKNTEFGVMIGLSPKSLLGENSNEAMNFLINLLPKRIYIEAIVNLYDFVDNTVDLSPGTKIIVNESDSATTDKIFDILQKMLGEEFSVEKLTANTATTVRDMINKVRTIIGMDFVEGTDKNGAPEVYAKLNNIFQLMCEQMNLKNTIDEPVTADELKNLLNGLSFDKLTDGNLNEVVNNLIVRDTGETVDAYLNDATNGLAARADTFVDRLNNSYYIKAANKISADTLMSGNITSDVIGVNSIDGVRLRNESSVYNDIPQVLLDDRALTHVIKTKLEGEGGTTLGSGISLMQVTIDRDSSRTGGKVWIRLVLEVSLGSYAADAAAKLPGLVPEKMYVTSITKFDDFAANIIIAQDDTDSTEIAINNFGADTALLVKILKDAAGFDVFSMRQVISEALKTSLTAVEDNLNKAGENPIMEYSAQGIMLPNIFELMCNIALKVPEIESGDSGAEPQYTKLTPMQLMDVVVSLENKPDFVGAAEKYYPSLGNYYNSATGAYDMTAFENARALYFSETLGGAKTDFESDLQAKFFLKNPVNTDDLFNTGADAIYSLDKMGEFDGAALRANSAKLSEMSFVMSERALAKIINDKLKVSDSAGTVSDSVFEVIAVEVAKDAGTGNIIFNIVIDAQIGSLAEAGDLMPRLYLNAAIKLNAGNAADAKSNKTAGVNAPETIISINQMDSVKTSLFKAMTAQLGVKFSFDTVAATLESSLLDSLAGFESLIKIKYNDSGIEMPSIYSLINKMISDKVDRDNATGSTSRVYDVSELELKELLENIDMSSKLYINETGAPTSPSSLKLNFPAAKDYDTEASYMEAKNKYETKLLDAENTFYNSLKSTYYINNAITLDKNTLMQSESASIFAFDNLSTTFDLAAVQNASDTELEENKSYLSSYALVNLFSPSGISNDSDIDNDMGVYSGAKVIGTKIYNDAGSPHIDVTIELNVVNQYMLSLLPEKMYITSTIFKDANVWKQKGAAGSAVFNNLKDKTHSTGGGMQAAFEKVLTIGFGNGSGFDEILAKMSVVMCEAVETLENQLPDAISYGMIPGDFVWDSSGDIETGVGVVIFPSTVGLFKSIFVKANVPGAENLTTGATLKAVLAAIATP